MSKRWYGSIDNRLEENKMYCDEIKVGTGVTEYSWSDRHAYEVIEVIDQKHVIIREYDHKLAGECYTNKWELISNESNPTMKLTKRGNYWYIENTLTKDALEELEKDIDSLIRIAVSGFDLDKVRTTGKQTKYKKINVSFGKAEYYYDYEF